MNEKKLKLKMLENDDTQATLAEALGIHQPTLNVKMKGVKAQFTQKEIKIIADRYRLNDAEIVSIFFANKGGGLERVK